MEVVWGRSPATDIHDPPVLRAAPSPDEPGQRILPARCPVLRVPRYRASTGAGADARSPLSCGRSSWGAPGRIRPFLWQAAPQERSPQEHPGLGACLAPALRGSSPADLPAAPASPAAPAGLRVLLARTWQSRVLRRYCCRINNKKQFPRQLGDYAALCAPHLPLTGSEEL